MFQRSLLLIQFTVCDFGEKTDSVKWEKEKEIEPNTFNLELYWNAIVMMKFLIHSNLDLRRFFALSMVGIMPIEISNNILKEMKYKWLKFKIKEKQRKKNSEKKVWQKSVGCDQLKLGITWKIFFVFLKPLLSEFKCCYDTGELNSFKS